MSETLNPNTLDVVSETPTQPMEGEVAPDDTQVEGEGVRAPKRVTSDPVVDATGLRSTRNPTNATKTEERLSFALDETYHLQSEAETLRAMLNAVRFTLVRRLGAGGMGVVYETYDQQRGELVALKTMRRVDPVGPGPVQAGVPLAQRHHPPQPGEPLRAVRGRRPLVLHHGAGGGLQLPELCEGDTARRPRRAGTPSRR